MIVQRSYDDPRNPGQWEFPGGKIDDGETLEAGLIREVQEETGFIIQPRQPIVHLETEMIQTGKYEGRLYLALFYAARHIGGKFHLSDEHRDYRWPEYHTAESWDLTTESRLALQAFRRLTDNY